MIGTIIFDFDGVILESVSVKTDAFRELFSCYPNHVDEIVRFHLDNGGMSRFDKFRYIYSHILKKELNAEIVNGLSERFSRLVFNKVLSCPFVAGAQEFIERNAQKYTFFIVSATPEAELIRIVDQRSMKKFFKGIYGSPIQKEENIRKIIREYKIAPVSVVFIGDARNDWNAARSTGIRFIARIKSGDTDQFTDMSCIDAKIPDLLNLHNIIRDLP